MQSKAPDITHIVVYDECLKLYLWNSAALIRHSTVTLMEPMFKPFRDLIEAMIPQSAQVVYSVI